MPDLCEGVVGGVDSHEHVHHVVELDGRGRRLGDEVFPTTRVGYEQLLQWFRQFGPISAIGIESTGAYAAGLTRFLRAAAVSVIEVNQPHAHTRHRRGKTDAIDAEAAARKVLSGEATTIPKDTTGIVEAIRQLRVARDSAVKARSVALTQVGELIITAPAELREQFTQKTLRGRARMGLRLRLDRSRIADPLQAAKLALHSLAARIQALDTEITELDTQLQLLVAGAAPRTTALLGVKTNNAGQLLVTAGQNLDRLRSEAAFAHLCAADPIPASSGKTNRHRLNPGGDRAANAALYMIVVTRLRYCERTRAYAARRTLEGRSKREIIRCLKPYIAREIYHSLQADLAALGARAGALDSA